MSVTTLQIYVQPGAKTTEISGYYDGRLKIRIQCRPVEGAANKGVVIFLAKKLNIASSSIEILKGLKSRKKTIQILGIKKDEVLKILEPKG